MTPHDKFEEWLIKELREQQMLASKSKFYNRGDWLLEANAKISLLKKIIAKYREFKENGSLTSDDSVREMHR